MDWKKQAMTGIIVGVVVGGILGVVATLYRQGVTTATLEQEIENLKTQTKLSSSNQEPKFEASPKEEIEIPLSAGWKAQGPGAKEGGYKDGTLALTANLRGGDAYAELFLDLRGVRLPGVEQNPDGSYDLADRELLALVRSDRNFKGEPSRPNGVQFLLKNKRWENLIGKWLPISDAMLTPDGMEVFFRVPDDKISRSVVGISLKFTIGSNSNVTYEGMFLIKSVRISPLN
ncbi:hypothetical protein MYX75_05545 [Acidobacteria bacterium AH-259-A15]|nr:hypothetical protein [Acidobacteria bacterium AH-259-A15]